MIEQKLALLGDLDYLRDDRLTLKGEFAGSIFGYELLLSEMHSDGVLDELDEVKLNALLSGLVFEPRKGDHPPRLSLTNERLLRGVERYHRIVRKKESKFRIFPYTRPAHFHLVPAIEAWTKGESFEKLFRLTTADEGELVRYFRMVIQLLRELAHAPHTSDRLRTTANRAREAMNRGVVDAERQLRV